MNTLTKKEIKALIKEQFMLIQEQMFPETEKAESINTTKGCPPENPGCRGRLEISQETGEGGGGKPDGEGDTPDTDDEGKSDATNTTDRTTDSSTDGETPEKTPEEEREAPVADQDDAANDASVPGETGQPVKTEPKNDTAPAPVSEPAPTPTEPVPEPAETPRQDTEEETDEEDNAIQTVSGESAVTTDDDAQHKFTFKPKNEKGKEKTLTITETANQMVFEIVQNSLAEIYSLDGDSTAVKNLTRVWFEFFKKPSKVDKGWTLFSPSESELNSDLKKVAYLSWLMSKGILKRSTGGSEQTFNDFSEGKNRMGLPLGPDGEPTGEVNYKDGYEDWKGKFFDSSLALAKLNISTDRLAKKVSSATAIAEPKGRDLGPRTEIP